MKFETGRRLGLWGCSASPVKGIWPRLRITKGDCFAKAHISAAPPPPGENTRFPRAHEDKRRPQSAGGPPQEGTPSAHPRINQGARSSPKAWGKTGRRFRAGCGWSAAESLILCTVQEDAARVPTSLFSFAPMLCRRAGSDSVSKRPWAEQWCAIESGGACAKSCAATGWKYPLESMSSYTRKARCAKRRLQPSSKSC